jgi:hypothetical protein
LVPDQPDSRIADRKPGSEVEQVPSSLAGWAHSVLLVIRSAENLPLQTHRAPVIWGNQQRMLDRISRRAPVARGQVLGREQREGFCLSPAK